MKKVFYASAYTTRFDILKKHWEKHSPKLANGAIGTSEPVVREKLGGMIFEIDWQKKI